MKQQFSDQPVRLLVRNADGSDLDDVKFRADINARLDPGIPSAGIKESWKGSVRHGGRSYVVTLRDGIWFHADTLDDEDEEEDDE